MAARKVKCILRTVTVKDPLLTLDGNGFSFLDPAARVTPRDLGASYNQVRNLSPVAGQDSPLLAAGLFVERGLCLSPRVANVTDACAPIIVDIRR